MPYDGDMLSDIGHIPFSDFWHRCEDLLPEDWAMQLIAKPYQGFLIYSAHAFLDDSELPTVPTMTSGWVSTPERAVERLFYGLRDGIVASGPIELPSLSPYVGEGDSLG